MITYSDNYVIRSKHQPYSSQHRSPSTQVTRCAMSWGEILHWDRSPAFSGWPQASSLKQNTMDKSGSWAQARSPFAETWVKKGELCLVPQTPRRAGSTRRRPDYLIFGSVSIILTVSPLLFSAKSRPRPPQAWPGEKRPPWLPSSLERPREGV